MWLKCLCPVLFGTHAINEKIKTCDISLRYSSPFVIFRDFSKLFCNNYSHFFLQVKIFSSSFGGTTLWENPKYVSPAKLRQAFSKKAGNKYERRVEKKAMYEATKPETGYPDIEGADFFKGDPIAKAEEALIKGNF